jgi:hypothetical protein
MKFRNTAGSLGISVVNDSRITFTQTGQYDIQFSAQLFNDAGGGNGNFFEIWLRKNGTNLPQSNTRVSAPSDNPYLVAAWDFLVDVTSVGDYFEIMWAVDSTSLKILTGGTLLGGGPNIPSAIATVIPVMHAEVGPQGPTGATGPAPTAPFTITQSANNVNYPLTISSANQQNGGAGWSDLIKIINSKSGATNVAKHLRIKDDGQLEIVNNAYTSTIFSISDSGNVNAAGSYNGASIGDTGWISVTSFNNGFTGNSVAYRKINNVVYLRGRLSGGTATAGAFFLPEGFRPSTIEVVIPCQQYGTANTTYVSVGNDGNVVPNATAAWLSPVIFPVG